MLTVRDAVVRFGETTAVDGVSLSILAGEVHALIGENGAGKSTLLRAIAGVTALDGGAIDSHRPLRIEWVPQELALAPNLTVAEAIFLGRERRRWGLLRRRAMTTAAQAALATIGCRVAPEAVIAELSPPLCKQVQLARAFHAGADVLLLDEPTAVLGQDDTAQLFATISATRDRGAAIVYVSHQIHEALGIANRVTVLRDGRHVSTDLAGALDVPTVVRRMVGRPLDPPRARVARAGSDQAGPRVRVSDLSSEVLRGVSFDAAAGEIVGLAGLLGSGRSEVLNAIAAVPGRPHPAIAVRGTVALVPEDRLRNGLIPTLSLRENIFLPAATVRLDHRREREDAVRWIERLRIRARGPHDLPDALSGGNQQKVLLARALRQQPEVLLLDEPTAGVDIGAKADIHAIVRAQADAGAAVVVASSELPELFTLCDRIVALRGGRHVGTVAVSDATAAQVGAWITGVA